MTELSIKIEGRNGALTAFRVINGAAHKDDAPTDMARIDGDDLTHSCSKKDLREWQTWVHQVNTLAARKTTASKSGNRRVLVEAGTVRVGDALPQGVVTGLGREWLPNADTFSVHGISPAASFVQYAYFD